MAQITDYHKDDQNNIALYNDLLTRHHDNHRALNWGSKASQELRFKILSEVNINKNSRILDVGCGLGNFYQWLKKQQFTPEYYGIDITPAMVQHTLKKCPGIQVQQGTLFNFPTSFPKQFDHVFASGLFYYRQNDPEHYLKSCIKIMFSMAKKSIAFNSLSAWANTRQDQEYYANPLNILDYCRTLTPKVSLRHDYHPADFTLYLYK